MKSHCPYCFSEKSQTKYLTYDIFEQHFEIAKCEQCNAFFLTPNPSLEQLAKAYDESYYGGREDEEKFEGLFEKVLQWFRKQRASRLANQLKTDSKILDIGCGNGQFLKFIYEQKEINIYGTEMPGSSAQRAKKIPNLNLHIGDLIDTKYPNQFFEAITLFHVFEHLTNPLAYLDEIDRIIAKDGILVMSFPNIDSWQSKFFKGKWLHLDPPRHLFFFEPKVFKTIMKTRGYRLERESYFSIEQNPYGAIQSWFNLFHDKRELLFEHLKGNTEYTNSHNKFLLKLEKLAFILSMPFFIIIDSIASLFKKSATVEFVFRKKLKRQLH
ncbi:MAG: class I SAM-dependent methyltransferase [Bacteroidales bacterium]|nr:class I SAM-dependent methyltransferase [Bacteroidales bacterium]